MQRHRAAAGQRLSCTTITVAQDGEFDPSLVTLDNCGLEESSIDLSVWDSPTISGYNTWRNENPDPDTTNLQAYIHAQVLVDGSPVPINVEDDHQYRRQVDNTSYDLIVSDGDSTHNAPFTMNVDDLPLGNLSVGGQVDLPIEVEVLTLEHRRLDEF